MENQIKVPAPHGDGGDASLSGEREVQSFVENLGCLIDEFDFGRMIKIGQTVDLWGVHIQHARQVGLANLEPVRISV
ncbi:hypothetical protein [Duganella sp. P38]|uniref:hypothetical protein n=1 Tax=Duganella sp. P38 TaxID=3423949 RepID=UPI003D7974BF